MSDTIINMERVVETMNKYLDSLGWDLRFHLDSNGELSYDEELFYAINGRGPGIQIKRKSPPSGGKSAFIQSIEGWIKKHQLQLNAFAVANSIAKKGTKGHPEVMDELYNVIMQALYDNIDTDYLVTSIVKQ